MAPQLKYFSGKMVYYIKMVKEGKAIPLQAWKGP
jgi:hypothetical protein